MTSIVAHRQRQLIRDAVVENGNKTLEHPLVIDINNELADNLNVTKEGLGGYGIAKVAIYSAQIATALAWGIDPEIIRYSGQVTDEEINKAYKKLADLDLVPAEV